MRYEDNAKYSAKIGLKAQSDSADALESMVARGSRVTMQLGNSHNVPIKCTAYSHTAEFYCDTISTDARGTNCVYKPGGSYISPCAPVLSFSSR